MPDPLQLLFAYLARGELPPEHVKRAAAARYVALLDQRPTRYRAEQVAELRAQGLKRAQILDRLTMSVDQYNRALRFEWRTDRHLEGVSLVRKRKKEPAA